MLEDPNEGCPF